MIGWKNPPGTLASGWDQMIRYFISTSTFHESVSHNSCYGGRVELLHRLKEKTAKKPNNEKTTNTPTKPNP